VGLSASACCPLQVKAAQLMMIAILGPGKVALDSLVARRLDEL
jgi:hypothetical protein